MCVCSFQTLNSLCDSTTELTSVERSNSSGAGKACRVTIPVDDKAKRMTALGRSKVKIKK